ncbi:unnamed protein product [Cylicocyclus nassatus]|uniref:Uncharacterized protein n=1 Tax=Cylicocyclus nassatus TaxID=53992 RepID=A0AA36DQV1_CYLNA|nr:unnamed protein product [Cylicocyclus nassatus]
MLYCYLAAVVFSTAPRALLAFECPGNPFITYQIYLTGPLREVGYERDCLLEEKAQIETVRALYDVFMNRSDINSTCEEILKASSDCKQCFVYVAQTKDDVAAAEQIGEKFVEEVKVQYHLHILLSNYLHFQ